MSDRLNPELEGLRNNLSSAFGRVFQRPDQWAASDVMSKALQQVRLAFDSSSIEINNNSSIAALSKFKQTGQFANFIDLKYGCFGITLPIQFGKSEWSVIGDESMLRSLLKQVDDEKKQPRRFRKCYQGLMHSYFGYPILDEDSEEIQSNWKVLQRYLGNRREIALSASNRPTWLLTLDRHANLLMNKPCEAYSADLLKGNRKKLVEATEGIGIGPESWVWQESILTTLDSVTSLRDDDEFRKKLSSMLDLLEGDAEIKLSEPVRLRCLAMLLIRYVKSKQRTEHPRLRDAAVNYIGNPWLKRASWDAYVKNDDARKMVDGWLKRRLITDFFALLSEDGAADERRLNYWLRFEPVIEDMWFALGSYARFANTSDFRDMRLRMEGRLHYLSGQGSPYNNAFLMKVGQYLVVEFGVTGNATYIYHAEDSRIDFSKKEMSMSRLKGDNHVGRLIHKADWERDFDNWLCPRIGWNPSKGSQPVSVKLPPPKPPITVAPPKKTSGGRLASATTSDLTAVFKLIFERQLKYEDNRHKGGPLWIRTNDTELVLNSKLLALGFRYTYGKGWWRE